MKREEIMR